LIFVCDKERGSTVLKCWAGGNLRQGRGVSLLRHRVQTDPAAHPAAISGAMGVPAEGGCPGADLPPPSSAGSIPGPTLYTCKSF
jgi:hypothetical protein